MTSCSLITVKPAPVQQEKIITKFPATPNFPKVESPIVGKSEENFIVKPEFVKLSMLLQGYIKNILEWKKINNLP